MVQILLWYIGQEGYKGKKEKLILRRPYNAGPPQVEEMVKELESKVVEIEAKIAEKVGENIEKTQQAVQGIQKEVGTALVAATSAPRKCLSCVVVILLQVFTMWCYHCVV